MSTKIHTYIYLTLFGVMSFCGIGIHQEHGVIVGESTYAADATDPAKKDSSDKKMQEMMETLVAALNTILAILTIIVTPAIMLASWLLSPDWTSGDVFGIRPILHDLWIMVSNVTYFIYAILLIFIALATIFNSDHYGYKQLLPKLALGILLVPLTWWFIGFMVSIASVVTASVMTIPAETMSTYNAATAKGNNWWTTPVIPQKIEYTNNVKLGEVIGKNKCSKGEACLTPEQITKNAGGAYGPLLIYAFGVFKIQEVFSINNSVDFISSILQVVHQGIIGAIMFFVFGLLVMALIFMLLARAIKLWFYAIFSPFMTLKFVLGDGIFGKEGGESFDLKEFIGLAFVPAIVGLCLSFGLIIIAAMKIAGADDGTGTQNPNCLDTICKINIMGGTTNYLSSEKIGTDDKAYTKNVIAIGGITYTYNGSVTGGEIVSGAQSVLSSSGGIIGTVIIDIIALVFVWVAFMAAKGVSKVAQAAFSPFEKIGTQVGSLAASLPKYAPILPGGMSANSMNKVIGKIETKIETNSNQKAADSKLGRLVGLEGELSTDYANMNQALKDETMSIQGITQVRKNAAKIIAMKGTGSSEGQSAMEDMRKIAMKDPKLAKYIEKIDLIKNGEITEAGIKLLEGDLNSTVWSGTLAKDADIKKWKEKRTYTSSTNTEEKNTDTISVSVKGKPEDKIYNVGIKGVNVEIDANKSIIDDIAMKNVVEKIGDKELDKTDFKATLINNLKSILSATDATTMADKIISGIDSSKFKS